MEGVYQHVCSITAIILINLNEAKKHMLQFINALAHVACILIKTRALLNDNKNSWICIDIWAGENCNASKYLNVDERNVNNEN